MGERDPEPTPAAAGRLRRWGAHLRGLVVALHIVAVTLMALPTPGEGLFRPAWKDPTVQGEFAFWTGVLNRWGVPINQNEFEDRLWTVAVRYTEIGNTVRAPFRYYYEVCGTAQGWRMFAGPHRDPVRFSVEVAEDGEWRTVFRQSDPEHTWRASQLENYRFRPALYRFGWYVYSGDDNQLDQFAAWVAHQARRDFPRATQVRVRLYKSRTPSPEEVRAGQPPEGRFVKDLVVDVDSPTPFDTPQSTAPSQ